MGTQRIPFDPIYNALSKVLILHLYNLYGMMSEVRVSVEWIFGDIINYFKFLDFKKNLKIGLSAVGKMYTIAALLHNARAILHGTQTLKFFDLEPPSLRDYFQ